MEEGCICVEGGEGGEIGFAEGSFLCSVLPIILNMVRT